MAGLRLPPGSTVYLDSAPIIYSVEKIEPYRTLMRTLWEGGEGGHLTLITSELTLLELAVGPRKRGDVQLESLYRQLLLNTRAIQVEAISRAVLEEAIMLRALHGLKTPDAIHGATAIRAGCTHLVTNDRGFGRLPGVAVILLSDLRAP